MMVGTKCTRRKSTLLRALQTERYNVEEEYAVTSLQQLGDGASRVA
jgi:hypothetical protein